MIQANELRIGSLVCVGINRSMDMVYGTILLIDATTQSVLIESNGEKTIMTLSQLEPIILTEDMLLKFGLVYKNGYGYKFKYGWISRKDKYWSYHGLMIKIKYVHQLQNLDFALTGQELTFKN